MSKNTGTSELINYFTLGVNGDVGIGGNLTLSTIVNATVDTDRFLVSDGGIIKYRTGSEVLSDIGGQAALTNPVTGTGTINYLPKFTGSTTIGNSQIFDNGTNVGINQASPTRTLDILGASGIGTVLKLQGASGTTTYLQLAYNGATNAQSGYIGYNSSSQMQFFTNDILALTIDSNRNVGIGTNSPTNGLLVINSTASNGVRFALESSGTMNGIVALGSNAISGLSTTDMALWTRGVMAFETGASGEKMRITSGGNVGIGTTTAASAVSGSARVLAIVDNATANVGSVRVYGGGTATSLELYGGGSLVGLFGSTNHPMTFSTNSVEAMRIFSGQNVHIGPTPVSDNGARLQVSGAGTFTGTGLLASVRINNTTASTGKDWHLYSLNNGNFGLYNNTDGSYAYQVTPAGAATFSSSVTAGGNISSNITKSGVGVENVNFLQLRLFGTNAIGDSLDIRYLNNNGNNIANISAILGGDNVAYGSLAFSTRNFFTDSMVEVMRINNRGNVGINTSSPVGGAGAGDRTLAVNANAGSASFVTGMVNGTRYSTLFTSISGLVLETNAVIPLTLSINSVPRLTLDTTGGSTFSGSVTAVNAILSGTGSTFADGLRINRTTSNSTQYTVINHVGGATNIVSVDQSGNNIAEIYFGRSINGSTISTSMVINGSGRVGIGTPSPSTLLHVNGSGTIGRFQSSISYVDLSFINSTSSNGFIQYNGNNFNFFANSGSTPTMTITGGAPGNVLIGTTTDNGNRLQVSGVAQASNFITDSGTASILTFSVGYSVFYTCASNQNAIYLVTLQLNGFSDYTAYATICQNNNGLVIMNQVNNVAYIRVSGLNIEGSQNSGSTQSMRWRIIKIGQ